MTPQEIEAKVIEIVARQFATSKEKITRATVLQNDLGGDSLDAVELIMELEDAFGIEIPDSVAEKIKTVGDVISCAVEKTKNKA
jgi:acyl carrier protein